MLLRAVLALLTAPNGSLLLDVGCGLGDHGRVLPAHGLHVVGLDTVFRMVHEARQQALREDVRVLMVQADARALPAPDAVYDPVLAAHLLFHLPDQASALREMRPVLRPGGRVVLTTKAANNNQAFYELHAEAAREADYTPTPSVSSRFSWDDLALVRSVLPAAEQYIYEDRLRFPTADAAVQYYETGIVDAVSERTDDDRHRRQLLPRVRDRLEAVVRREGVLQVPRTVGCSWRTCKRAGHHAALPRLVGHGT